MNQATSASDVMLRINDVKKMTGLSKSTIYSEVQAGRFPKPVRLTKRCSAWVNAEIGSHLQARINASRNPAKGGV